MPESAQARESRPSQCPREVLGVSGILLSICGLILWEIYFTYGPHSVRQIARSLMLVAIAFGVIPVFRGRGARRLIGLWAAILGLLCLCLRTLQVTLALMANPFPCEPNIRKIREALRNYADKHGGRLPDTLDAQVDQGELTPETLTCVGSWEHPYRAGKGPRYVYLGAVQRLAELSADDPLVADAIGTHDGHGGSVGYADGHVEWVLESGLSRELAASQARIAARTNASTRPALIEP